MTPDELEAIRDLTWAVQQLTDAVGDLRDLLTPVVPRAVEPVDAGGSRSICADATGDVIFYGKANLNGGNEP